MNDIAKMIDHTLLRQDLKKGDLKNHCEAATKYGFYSVVVQPLQLKKAKKYLEGSGVLVGTVIGFPFGEETTKVKVFEAKQAIKDGADELDMVMQVSSAKQGNWKSVQKDIEKVVAVAQKRPVKVIIETVFLTKSEIIKACQCAIDGGASFAKTSTGYFKQGATVENVKIMSEACRDKIAVKAAGGVRTLADCVEMINAGATRIGTSGGVEILNGIKLEKTIY